MRRSTNYKKLTLADVKKFYADFYGASNAELAVVGDFDAAEVQKLATELFGSWKSPAPYTRVKRDWNKLETVNRSIETPDKANAIFLAITTMPVNDDDPDYPALFVANTMLGGGPRIASVPAHSRKGRLKLSGCEPVRGRHERRNSRSLSPGASAIRRTS